MSQKIVACYIIRHKTTNKFYVGSTKDYLARKAHHKWSLKNSSCRCKALQELYDIEKDFDLFEWTVYICDDRETAYKIEDVLIKEGARGNLMLNSSLDARSPISGIKITEEMRNKATENHKKNFQNPEFRSKFSDSIKKAWDAPGRRERRSGAGNPFAKALTVDGVLYGSVKDAERSLGLNEKTIRKRVNSYDHPTYKWVTGQ